MKIALSVLWSTISLTIFSQSIDWNWLHLSSNAGQSGLFSIDHYNNTVLSAGSSYGSVDFNGQSITSAEQCGIIYSTDSDGQAVWSKALLCSKGAHVLDLEVMSNGNVVALVTYRNKLQVEDQVLISNNTDTTFSSNHAVVCLSFEGELQWMKNTSGASPYWGRLALTPDNEIVISGFCADVTNFFSESPLSTLDSTELTTPWGETVWSYHHDLFGYIAKLDQNGNAMWVKSSGGFVNDIIIGPTGFIGIAGFLSNTTSIQSSVIQPFGTETGYYAQFDEEGNFQWIKRFGGSANDNRMKAVTLDPEGNIYVTGSVLGNNVQIEGLETFSWSECNAIVVKMNPAGDVDWYRLMGVDNWNLDEPNFNSGVDIVYAENGVFVTGYASNYINNGGFNLYSDGAPDLFLLHFDDQGVCNYSKNYVTYGWNMGAGITYMNGDLYLCGYSYGENWSSAEPSYCLLGKIASSDIVLSILPSGESQHSFDVFPNPFKDEIQITRANQTPAEYYLYDALGKLIRKEKTCGNTVLNLSELPNGMFYLTDISTGDQKKLIKR